MDLAYEVGKSILVSTVATASALLVSAVLRRVIR